MMNQLSLLELTPIQQPATVKELTIQQRFEAFHRLNPQVYVALEAMTMQLFDTGIKRYGIKGLIESLRWEYAIRTRGDAFRICNSYSSRYARLLVKNHPEWKDFFELRSLRERNCEAGK